MAAITSAQSGNWSATTTWTGGVVPIEGDTVTIQDTHVVTIDQNITIGDDTTTAAINIAAGGKLELLSTAAADYILTLKGDLTVSGTLEIGTTTNPIPLARKFTIKTNYSATLADGKYGTKVLIGGTCTIQGAALSYDRALLAADAAAAATSLTTSVSTGWKAGDVIGIASTTQTYSQCEKGTLSVDA
ncbi:MAG: G8 domain-containing protein, partial [Nitrospirota bacterium]